MRAVPPPDPDLESTVRRALAEDLGAGDVTAELIPAGARARARVITREAAVLCGGAWFDEVYRQLDPEVSVGWLRRDADRLRPGEEICHLEGPTRSLLSGERTALNFLQLLSATATAARHYAEAVAGTGTQILDTRKTLPGLRRAQKYAVRCGGARNHRMGLFDAVLIKENHIAAAGSVGQAVTRARHAHPELTVEVEVESLADLEAAIEAGAQMIMLDNFDDAQVDQAVALTAGRARLEVSGNVELERLARLAAAGVDYVSIGAMTKHVRAVDLSMRLEPVNAPS